MDASVIQQVIETYGYLALFVGTFVEGETFFLLGGIAARQGLLDPWYVGLAAGLGGVTGDLFFFLLGRLRGEAFVGRFDRVARKAAVVRRLVRRHAVVLMLSSRFLYGFRMVIPLACGAARVRPLTFVLLNLLSALAWTLSFGGLGYLFGGWVSSHLDLVKNLQIMGGLILAVVVASVILGGVIRRRMMKTS